HVIDRNAALEAAIIALGETAFLVLRFALSLAADGQHAVGEFDIDILLFETGEFGSHLHLLVSFADFHVWPAHRMTMAERADLKGTKSVVEKTVHFAMESKERVARIVVAQLARGVV